MKIYEEFKKIDQYSRELNGILTISDLKNFFNLFNQTALYRRIKKYEKEGIIRRFSKGIYLADNFSLEQLSSRIIENSYISFGYILSKYLVIGSSPKYSLLCIKEGKKRIFKNDKYKITYLSIDQNLFFGYETVDGINYALKEKALLDTLYYYQKGYKFSFNIFEDINYALINKKVLFSFLKKYRNPKFISFVKGLIK